MRIERDIIKEFKRWKDDAHRKPILLKGARQIGKTWTMETFGKECFEYCAHFDFDRQPELKTVFQASKDPARIVKELALYCDVPLEAGKTLLIFDEIQECEEALNSLKYFHEESEHRYIVPILVATDAPEMGMTNTIFYDKIFDTVRANASNIAERIRAVFSIITADSDISRNAWINSRYRPTPTIIEAAQALYQNHDVKEISRNDAGADNLESTNAAINYIIEDCKRNNKKV